MLPGAQRIFTVTVTPAEAQTIDAADASLSDDPDTGNNHAIVEHAITAVADLMVAKSGP